ncbi:GNAT family N-acetyltransferase [Desmospora profundinema]|uniref:GNAT superfamily N-acetyltransferase n=1 Tax=Desmospora profundinema TaxID=1571184 RepID=A0ABU1IID4_9BACL|nr:GNAT family N-acetyltransferase [Desmospora profundinema]MDR6224451.1 GNAT superfamily N-acetyltransferase [Desmospora profundinema]
MHKPFEIRTAADNLMLLEKVDQLARQSFTPFFFEGDQAVVRYWKEMMIRCRSFQFALFQEQELVGAGVTVPLYWDGTLTGLPETAESIYLPSAKEPNVLCALAALIPPEHQGKGISPYVLNAMKSLARQHGFSSLIVPVYPHHKSNYPLVPMERYMHWRRGDGLPFDPWIRVHWRLGGKILKIMPKASVVRGTIERWERWSGLRFLDSGLYIVPETINPVQIDLEKNEGIYIEPNVWMEHFA